MPPENGDSQFELQPDTAVAYFRRHGHLPDEGPVDVHSLGGGVSNDVLRLDWDGGCLVAKQPLPDLAVEDNWSADVERVHNEAAAAQAFRSALDVGDYLAEVPRILFENEVDHVIAIECAPSGARMWKAELLEGRVDDRVATALGAALGAVHVAAADNGLSESFGSKRPFDQLRIEPYHRTTARRHPDVADVIDTEIERIRSVDQTLVHGDYSPKNVLVDRASSTPVPWIIDFEVAHWGDPAFDTAFMLNHLLIKAMFKHDQFDKYIDTARSFWDSYRAVCEWDIERETVAELGVLMLARVDGKSPMEYIDEGPTADALRTTAKRALRTETTTIDGFVDIAATEVTSV